MILNCPSCGAKFSFKRSAFSKTTRRRGKCIKCDTFFIIGPLSPFPHHSKGEAPKSQKTAYKKPARQSKMKKTWSNKRKKVWTLAFLLTLALLPAGFYFYKASTIDYSQKPFLSLAFPEVRNTIVLEITNLELGWKTNKSTAQLSIQGELSNPSNVAAKSTGVTITLLDENDMPVLVWDHEIPGQVIPPGQHIQFQTSADTPPPNAASVMVRLKLAPTLSK